MNEKFKIKNPKRKKSLKYVADKFSYILEAK